MLKRIVILIGMLGAASIGHAAEIKCLCPVAMNSVLNDLAPQFERASGHKLTVELATLGVINERVGKGESADVAVVLPQQAEQLEKQSRFIAGSRVELARAGYGAIVRKGTPKPDMSSVDALKRTLLSAKTISYGDPSAGGPVGIYIAGLIERLGLVSELKPKTKLVQNAELVLPAVVNGDAEIGITLSSATASTVEFVTLPTDVQNYTIYMAAVMANSKQADAAKALLTFLTSPDAKNAMRAKGFETR